ncbi:preprotein translocase subunit SecA [Candidatus Peregrinibacteria bacterium]|nr:preprotein translocase subunit SecA [Candidatus Peregrinibacteria bacterium]
MVVTKIINKIIGDPNDKAIARLKPMVEHINQIEEKYQNELKTEDIPKKTDEFKSRLEKGETLEDLLPEAFALVKFACRQLIGEKWEIRGHQTEWNMIPYDVQIIGGIILHQGKVTEMKTGEGKTLACTMPIYLNALTGKGTHLVTVNDYLAERDAEWMGGVYRLLGLTVGVNKHGLSPEDKKAAYKADVTYSTNNEMGFDYLRDNMARFPEHKAQRNLYYAIVDEVDSILIDEARTPLIISQPAEESTQKYLQYNTLVDKLEENTHYNVDEKAKTAVLSEQGIKKMEEFLGVENIYTDAGFQEVHHIEQALRAKTAYQKDIDYVLNDKQVVIVDEFTGRLMPGRRFSHGLHQAIEAKEWVPIKRESKTMATITFQNFFRMYEKLAGMTGTAVTEAEEFGAIYNLETLVIPTHEPITRQDLPDVVYKTVQAKFMAIAKKTKELHEKGQPSLIGTISVEKSEMLSKLLSVQGIKHNVLNAKHHQREAEIVSQAGQKGAVTIATNMAGRGTDIKLGEGVIELGGLYVAGTERHESRRIDNQLRGRSGRQGDPGTTQFYLSMEDELMRLFGSDRIKATMERLGIPDDMPIENRMISRSVESAQKKVEGRNFDIRKHLVEYDNVMNTHREIMYKRRNNFLTNENIHDEIKELINKEANDIVMFHAALETKEKWNYKEIAETLSNLCYSDNKISEEELKKYKISDEIVPVAQKFLRLEYTEKEATMPSPELMRQVERAIAFRILDTLWMEHINEMTQLRERVALRSYGQRNPLIEYQNEGFELFGELNNMIQTQIVSTLFKVRVRQAEKQAQLAPLLPMQMKTNASAIEGSLSKSQLARVIGANPGSAGTPVQAGTFATAGIQKISAGSTMNEPQEKPTKVDPKNVSVVSADDPTPGFPERQPKEQPDPAAYEKVGRNDPCPCGSEKKYKKCCGR